MKILATAILATLMASPVLVQAAPGDSCAEAIHMDNNTTIDGETCSGPAGWDMAGVIIAHHYKVYEFTYGDDGGMDPEPDQIQVGTPGFNAIVTTSCNVAPIGGADFTHPFSVEGLVEGQQYFVFVTHDVSTPVPADGPLCGDYSMQTDTLPVELQSFTID